MRSLPLSIPILALALGSGLFAQEATKEAAREPTTEGKETVGLTSKTFNGFEKGDGILSLSVGAVFPLGFYHPTASASMPAGFQPANAYPGFSFSLAYAGFLSPEWALEGVLSGGFIGTMSDNTLFLAPLSLSAARYFTLGSFAIAPGAGLGVAISSLGSAKHIDGLFRFGSAFHWKASQDMSYSLKLFGNVIPQFYTDATQNMVGFFLDATLSVAYHL